MEGRVQRLDRGVLHDSPGEAPEHSRTLASLLLASHALTQELSGWSDDPPDGALQLVR